MMPNTSAWYFVFLGIVAFSQIAEVIYAKGLSKKAGARGDKPEKEKTSSPWSHSIPCFFVASRPRFFGK